MKTVFPLAKAGLMAVAAAAVFLVAYELHWRGQGYQISYNNNEALWADKRAEVYGSTEKTTVFIGSSRIKFDLDIPTWEQKTGETAVQLALEGTSPRLLLEDLANDRNFKGKLVVDMTESLFFTPDGPNRPNRRSSESIKYYRNLSPTQRFGFQVNRLLESQLVFLESELFSIKTLLNGVRLPPRPGVFSPPPFPKKFVTVAFNRQTSMTDDFLADTAMRNQMKRIWILNGGPPNQKGVGGDTLGRIISQVKTAVAKIHARGGKVIFVRTPTSGTLLDGEKKKYPRNLYWERLLAETKSGGIHYEDYPAIAHFNCPEWSHLTPADGKVFTSELAGILAGKNWFSQAITKR